MNFTLAKLFAKRINIKLIKNEGHSEYLFILYNIIFVNNKQYIECP